MLIAIRLHQAQIHIPLGAPADRMTLHIHVGPTLTATPDGTIAPANSPPPTKLTNGPARLLALHIRPTPRRHQPAPRPRCQQPPNNPTRQTANSPPTYRIVTRKTGLAEELTGLTPAYIATAGFDPLRDEGEEYGGRLRAAGVPVALHRHEGLIHAFVNAIGVGHIGRDALLEAAGALRVGLATARRD